MNGYARMNARKYFEAGRKPIFQTVLLAGIRFFCSIIFSGWVSWMVRKDLLLHEQHRCIPTGNIITFEQLNEQSVNRN